MDWNAIIATEISPHRCNVLDQVKFPESTFYVPQIESAEPADAGSIDDLFGQAMSEPVDFPLIGQFVLDGDRLAIVLLGNLPEPVKSLAAVMHHIADSVQNPNIVAVISPSHADNFNEEAKSYITSQCPDIEIEYCVHDPHDQRAVACIANNQAGEPVYVNRMMFDADVVIPVGTWSDGGSPSDSFYPEFSSDEVRERFKHHKDSRQQLSAEVRLAEQNLGAEFSILVVRGPGGNIVGVRAGNSRAIRSSTDTEMSSLWSIECQRDGELVVATIEGSSEQQSWDDVFRALAAASASSESVQQIVICSSVSQEPDPEQMEVLQLQFEVDLDSKCRKLGQLTGVNRSIPDILESKSVYLMSRLDQDSVEEAGLGYIESDREIQRIVDRASSGILLRDAHLCRVATSG